MVFLIKTALRSLRRSYRSTLVLGLMIFAAVAGLVFLSALAVGTNDAMIRNSVGLFSGHIAATGLPAGVDRSEAAVAGTAGILIRRSRPALLARHGRTAAASVLLTGVEPEEEKELTALWRKTIAGRYPERGRSDIYLSRPAAESLQVWVGDVLQVHLESDRDVRRMRVCGIYETGVSGLDYERAFCPLSMLPANGNGVSAAIFLEAGVAPDPVLRTLRRRFESARFEPWTAFMPDLKQLIVLNLVSMTIVMFLVFGIVSIGIACAMIIFFLKNLREFGILKAMGILPGEMAVFILAQVTTLTLAAALAGTAAGAGAVAALAGTGIDLSSFTSQNPYFAVSGVIYPRLTLFSACLPAVLALVFGMLAAVWPALFVTRKKAADILRSV